MARALLRDDFRQPGPGLLGTGTVRLAVDEDAVSRAIDAGLVDDPNPSPEVDVTPLLSVRDRVQSGYDENDNPTWTWVDRITDARAITWMKRTEIDDSAGTTRVVADVTVLYPQTAPVIRETASARTSDGVVWRVTDIARYPDRLRMILEQVEHGA